MCPDVNVTVVQITIAACRINLHEFLDEVDGITADRVGHCDMSNSFDNAFVEDNLVDLRGELRLFVERWHPAKHLENEDAEGVPIHAVIISSLFNDLRCWFKGGTGNIMEECTSGAR